MNKVAGLARALGILLAIVAGFVAIPNLNVALVLVILGLIAGLSVKGEDLTGLILAVLVLPAVGMALGNIPSIGAHLAALAGNLALTLAGAAATAIATATYSYVKGDLMGLTKQA